MDAAAERIWKELEAAKVEPADLERVKRFVEEAHEWSPEHAAEIAAIARYVCGLDPALPAPSQEVLEHDVAELLSGIEMGTARDEWDQRALKVIALVAKDRSWHWNLEQWLNHRVEDLPAEPVFDRALALLRAVGVWSDDEEVLTSVLGPYLTAHVTADGVVTSAGRWLLSRIDRDAEAVLAFARAHKNQKGKVEDRTSALFRLLVRHRRPLFERMVETFPPATDDARQELAHVMLEADAAHYEEAVVKLVTGLRVPFEAANAAKDLHESLPGKHRELLRELLLAGMGKSSAAGIAYPIAWPALGDGAFEIWSAYHVESDATRLEFYEAIEQQAGEKTLPWLVEGLVYPKDPSHEYGHVTHAKYVTRMADLVRKYDLAPYRERIAKAFEVIQDRKIREVVDELLGIAPSAPAPRRAFDAKKGYRLDAYGAALVEAGLAALQGVTLPSPIERVKLGGFQGELSLSFLVVEGKGAPAEVELVRPESRLPAHVDVELDEDEVLRRFAKLHGLEEGSDELPAWGGTYELPTCVLIHEQLAAVHAIVARLAARGAQVAERCRIGVGADDTFCEGLEEFAQRSRAEVAALPRAQQADFAALCFEDPGKRAWLLGR